MTPESTDLQQQLDELQSTNRTLLKSIEDFLSIRNAMRDILSSESAVDMIGNFVDAVENLVPSGDLHLFLAEPRTGNLQHYGAMTDKDPEPPAPELLNWIIADRKPSTTMPTAGEGFLTFLPLYGQSELVGIMTIDTTTLGAEGISQQLLEMLAVLAGTAAMALEIRDLVDQMHNQVDELNTTRTHLSNILDSINSGILTLDNESLVTGMNRNLSAMLEIDPGETEGSSYREALPAQLADLLDHQVEQLESLGFCEERQFSHTPTGGVELPLAVGVSQLRNEQLDVIGTVVILRDMTASKELERLRKLDTLKSEFVANVSHELKTPLTSIKAYTEALQDMAEEEIQSNFLNVIDEESDRLLFLIEDLLNISKIESGKLNLKLDRYAPQEMVEEIKTISKIKSEKHELAYNYSDDLPESFLYDKARMKEVMINLVGNAIKYSPEGGTVTVAMDTWEGNLRIAVSDQGIGIPEGQVEKVFEKFFRVDSSLTAEIGGTGLGLAITRNIIDTHGGRIMVESTYGEGTTFTVLLPMRQK